MAEILSREEMEAIREQQVCFVDRTQDYLAQTALHYMDRAAEREDATAMIMDEWGAMAREWDRYWTAAGVGDGSISVDDAIARWQEMEERVKELEAAQERTWTWTRTDEDEGWLTSHDEYLRYPDGGPWRYCEDCGGRIVTVDISQSA